MLKIFRNHAIGVVAILRYLQRREVNRTDIIEDVMEAVRWREGESTPPAAETQLLRDYIENAEYTKLDLEDVSRVIVESLSTDGSGSKSGGELIEALAGVLQAPFAKNVLSGRTLGQLRQAVLTDEEQTGLSRRLNQREMSCGGCGRDLRPGQLVVMSTEYSGGGNIHFVVCTSCQQPSTMACQHDHCANQVPIFEKILKWLSKGHLCEKHNKKSNEDAPSDETPERPTDEIQGLIGQLDGGFLAAETMPILTDRVMFTPRQAWGMMENIQPPANVPPAAGRGDAGRAIGERFWNRSASIPRRNR